ncbi:RAS1 protein [Coemansia erecta]|nr:RAS1 protein [Coemansia erecta]
MSHMLVPEYKIVMLGSGGVGKSMITTKYMNGSFSDEYDPTIEDSYRRQCTVDGDTCVIEILDTAGQEEYAAMQDNHIRSGDCFVVVYSVADRQTLQEAKMVVQKIFRTKDTDHVPIVLVGNKCDLPYHTVETREGMEYARSIHSGFYEASARNNIKIDDVFAQCIRRIKRFRKFAEPQSAPLTDESRSPSHLKYNKGLGNTKSWIAGFRANKEKIVPMPTHQSLPERYMGKTFPSVTAEKRHRSNTETDTQSVKRKTTELSSPSAKRRSTSKSNGRSKATTPRPAGPSRDSIRVVTLGNDQSRTPYGIGAERSKSQKRGMDSASQSARRHEKASQRHAQTARSINVNKDLPQPNHKKLKSAPACTIL